MINMQRLAGLRARSGSSAHKSGTNIALPKQLSRSLRLKVSAARAQDPEKAKAKTKAAASPKKRGPKPTTSAGDGLQLLDAGVLEELKATAAMEEAARAAQPTDPEADPARFNFHRILMAAASRGLPEQAEQQVAQMQENGFPPGPRAYHALVFSYVRAKLPYDALDAAKRAVDQGLKLLPETFIILIFSALNHPEEPDVATAQQVLESFEAQEDGVGRPQGAQPGWLMLCKELFRKGLISAAMNSVKRGYDTRGYASDPELTAHVVEQLAKAGLKDRAYQEVDALVAQGYRPGPQHYNHLIKAEAAMGAWRRARYLLLDAFGKPTWQPPSVDSFNALLQGMVLSVDPETGLPTGAGVHSDVGGRIMDVQKPSQPGQGSGTAARALVEEFGRLRGEMLLYGLRPNAESSAAMCTGYIKVRAADEALGLFEAMMNSGGNTRLLPKKKLSDLLVMLAEEDRPADMLNVLKAMVASNQPLPKSAGAVLGHITPGATLTTAWLPAHFDYMRAHPDDGTGQGAGSSALASMKHMLAQATEVREVDGVPLSVLGGCVVADDGSGVWLKPSRCTADQLEVELEEAGIEYDPDARKSKLVALVKARREALPAKLLELQGHLEAAHKAELEALERKTGISLSEKGPQAKKKGKVELRQFNIRVLEDGKLRETQVVTEEVIKRRSSGFTLERGGTDPYGMGDAMDEEGGGRRLPYDEDTDELSDILKEGVDEGVGDILRDQEDNPFAEGEAGEAAAQQVDSLDITVDHMEARVLNTTAGMRVAFEVLRCIELLGGSPTGPDYEALVAGTVAENNADVALELSERLPRLLDLGYSQGAVAGLYEQLARVCLGMLRAASADLILERAEDLKLEIDPALYAALAKALAGRPRHRELAASEIQEMVEDAATAQLLTSEDEAQELADQQASSGLAAEEDEEEDEEAMGAYGRPPTRVPEPGEEAPAGQPQLLQEDPAWQAAQDQSGGEEVGGVALAPLTFSVLSQLDSEPVSSSTMSELVSTAELLLAPSVAELVPPKTEIDEGEAEETDAGVMDLGDGVLVGRDQVAALEAALEQGADPVDALVTAGLMERPQAQQMAAQMQRVLEGVEQEDEGEELSEEDQQVLSMLQSMLGGELLEELNTAKQSLQELEDQAAEGDESAAVEAQALQEDMQGLLEQRFQDFLEALGEEEEEAGLQASGLREDTQGLPTDAQYRAAAREFYQEVAAAMGQDPAAAVQGWDQAPAFAELSSVHEADIDQVLQLLSEQEDPQQLLEQLVALEKLAPGGTGASSRNNTAAAPAPTSSRAGSVGRGQARGPIRRAGSRQPSY